MSAWTPVQATFGFPVYRAKLTSGNDKNKIRELKFLHLFQLSDQLMRPCSFFPSLCTDTFRTTTYHADMFFRQSSFGEIFGATFLFLINYTFIFIFT